MTSEKIKELDDIRQHIQYFDTLKNTIDAVTGEQRFLTCLERDKEGKLNIVAGVGFLPDELKEEFKTKCDEYKKLWEDKLEAF